jgi:hypothetical protein
MRSQVTLECGRAVRVIAAAMVLFAAAMLLFAAAAAGAQPDENAAREALAALERVDPFMGDWQGTFKQRNLKTSTPMVAQIVALGKGRYHASLLPAFDARTSPIAGLEAVFTTGAKSLAFIGWGDVSDYCGPDWTGAIEGGEFRGSVPARNGGPFVLRHVVRLSPTLGAKPAAGAVVLFDGANLDQWEIPGKLGPLGARPAKWTIKDGFAEIPRGGGTIATKKKFGNYRLHLEFATPFMPDAREQSRGNSGVFCGGVEIQVLDTYGLGGRSKECGALYSRKAPDVNMCAPPTQWQTYDVTVATPKDAGNTRLTVVHNGVKVHDAVDVGRRAVEDSIRLQDHGNPLRYRNIWLVETP